MSKNTRKALALIEKAVELLVEEGCAYEAHTLMDWLINDAPREETR